MKKALSLVLSGTLALSALSACAGGGEESAGGSGDKVKIEFLQYKSEAKDTFDDLIAKFEEENPTIDVVQTNPPDSETVLKTRVAKRDIPDVMGTGLNAVFSELTDAGVFQDVTGDPALDNIQPAYVEMMKDVTGKEEVYGFPYAANADAVIYNKAIFEELGLEVPKTWDEFIAAAETVKEAGKIPFYFTFKDSWTTLPAFNALAVNTTEEDFFKRLHADKTSFTEDYQEATEKFVKLLDYGHSENSGKAYPDGNVAFANGESAMYLQGIWAITEIKKANPDIDLGVFPYPAENPENTKLVSGVDLLLSISSQTEHPEEAKKFIEFLLDPETAQQYIEEQKAFSAVQGVEQNDAAFEGLNEMFEKGALVDFPDHYIPPAVGLDKLLQELTQKKDVDAFLKNLDTEWEKVQSRN
ncbi:ABC transporter substrate-binding protein [Bacillus taeanensis]|uniref:Carbohydrate ABC transporter substrate-binding protein n=1 Tax=Bacillus taeanensis TaxID=273032 RepID=A0A366XQD6_9BACI|nr:extracellular solute-binding protein [Bacillus taeanensis]RBW67926.1 carbohydrate ABC transporter substrate-binding protein [Bacillus taeanensis]